jgi:hypothetical protein
VWKLLKLKGWRHLDASVLQRFGLGAFQAGIILTAAIFVFQTMQSWCDRSIDPITLRWLFPAFAAVSVSLILGGTFHVIGLEKYIKDRTAGSVNSKTPEENLAISIIGYGKKLRSEGRDNALINLRNNFSHTLHVLGFHELRTELGGIALGSAVILGDTATRAEVLIDDLGWANFLLGHQEIAEKNIEHGIQVATEARTSAPEAQAVRLALSEAKGLRHLALINVKDVGQMQSRIDEAIGILQMLTQSSLEVKREISQIHHARALSIAMYLGIHKSGFIRETDVDGLAKITAALASVRISASGFKEISDRERYAKALALEVRLLEAKEAFTEAKETAAMRDRVLAESEWLRPEGKETLTGI